MNAYNFVFLSGMFRSGTTLLGTMLNAHPMIGFSLDPYLPIFKSFRTRVARDSFPEKQFNFEAALDDYYFYPDKQTLMREIQNTSLSVGFESEELPVLRNALISYSEDFSPRLGPLIEKIDGETYTDLLLSGIEQIRALYCQNGEALVGFKQAWTDEFSNHILDALPGSKVIHLLRDPRAVCASKNVNPSKYPWLFLIRQWRKSASFIWEHCLGPNARADTLFVKYEDLILHPEREARRLCKFIGVDFHNEMICPDSFRDGLGQPWVQNTSYASQAQRAFNTDSISKWKETLTSRQIELIERLCYPEMNVLGYECETAESCQVPHNLVSQPEVVPQAELVEWIQDDETVTKQGYMQEMAMEHWRSQVLTSGAPVDEVTKSAVCLMPSFFSRVQELMN